jgi:Rrf2 family protein
VQKRRILIQLALNYNTGVSVKGKTLSETQDITEPYIEQIMISLKRSGMVRAERGCAGGYLLSRPPESITLLEVIELFEGKLELVRCTKGSQTCARMPICETTRVWKRLSEAFRREAAAVTLAHIIEESAQGKLKQAEYTH